MTPHDLHHQQAMECMQAGKHVLLEKPMAINLEHCKALIAEGKRRHDSSGQVFMVSENAQYWPEVCSVCVRACVHACMRVCVCVCPRKTKDRADGMRDKKRPFPSTGFKPVSLGYAPIVLPITPREQARLASIETNTSDAHPPAPP